MSTQTTLEQVRWQDLKVRSDMDVVLEIAQKEGWKDCEVFGYGAMIKEPQESKGWKLIPADLYKDSIPPQAVERLHQIINAGIRVRGVIIADDERRAEPAAAAPAAPAKPKVSLPSLRPIITGIGKAFLGVLHSARAVVSFCRRVLLVLAHVAGEVMSWIGAVLLGIMYVVCGAVLVWGAFTLASFFAQTLIHLWWVIPIGLLVFGIACSGTGTSGSYDYDPKLVVVVDDGEGGTTWISLYTWYD